MNYARIMRVAAIVLLLAATVAAQERPLPDYEAFAERVKSGLATDQERQSGYTFTERRTEQRLDSRGRVRGESVKVYEIYPGLPGEDRYRRLIEEDGTPVGADTLAKRDRDRRKKAEAYARKIANTRGYQKAVREYETARRTYSAAVEDIFRVYDIRMLRRERVDEEDTILAELTPRRRAAPLTDDGKVMRHFKARAWISEADAELVRVEIEAIDALSFGLGLLARVDRGTTATYQRRRVNDEVWLPAQVTWSGAARVLLVRKLRRRGMAEFSNYRKFSVDTSTTIAPPAR